MPKTIIVANGLFPKHIAPFEMLHEAETIICCDGAVNKLLSQGFQPAVVIGDLDSIDHKKLEQQNIQIVHEPDQESNDLTKAFRWAVREGFRDIAILGATGLREDHTIGNIFLLFQYAKEANIQMVSDFGTFTPMLKSGSLPSFPKQQVSIFSPFGSKITSHGLKFPIENRILEELWQGTLNEALGNEFSLEIEGRGVVVYQTHEGKGNLSNE